MTQPARLPSPLARLFSFVNLNCCRSTGRGTRPSVDRRGLGPSRAAVSKLDEASVALWRRLRITDSQAGGMDSKSPTSAGPNLMGPNRKIGPVAWLPTAAGHFIIAATNSHPITVGMRRFKIIDSEESQALGMV